MLGPDLFCSWALLSMTKTYKYLSTCQAMLALVSSSLKKPELAHLPRACTGGWSSGCQLRGGNPWRVWIRWERAVLDETGTVTGSEDILGKSRAVPSAASPWLPVSEGNHTLACESALGKQSTKAIASWVPLQIIVYTMMQSVLSASSTDVCPSQSKQAYESCGKVQIGNDELWKQKQLKTLLLIFWQKL